MLLGGPFCTRGGRKGGGFLCTPRANAGGMGRGGGRGVRGTSRCLHAARAKRWLLVRSCPPAPRANGAPCTPTRRLPACKPCPCTPACTAWRAHLHALVHRTALVQGPFARSRSSHALPTSPAVCTRTPTCVAHSPPNPACIAHSRCKPRPSALPIGRRRRLRLHNPAPPLTRRPPIGRSGTASICTSTLFPPAPPCTPFAHSPSTAGSSSGAVCGGGGGKGDVRGSPRALWCPTAPPHRPTVHPPHHLHVHLHTQLHLHAPLHDPVVSARPTEPHSAP